MPRLIRSHRRRATPSTLLCWALVTWAAIGAVQPFNLSPRPNLVLREPRASDAATPERSSYFGFSINLRTSSILIGAPRSNSTLSNQLTIPEPGVIYRCAFPPPDDTSATLSTPVCAPFVFEPANSVEGTPHDYVYNGELRDNQWLGASMDGGTSDTDRLVVCAPRMHSYEQHGDQLFELNPGICYWTSNTTDAQPLDVHKINEMIYRDNRLRKENGEDVYYHMLGEQGLSVHVTDDGAEILVGAPGVSNWKGTVVRYREARGGSGGGIAKRDVNAVSRRATVYEKHVPNPRLWAMQSDSYFGYAVASGRFYGPLDGRQFYVASAPQANDQQGLVYVFEMTTDDNGMKSIRINQTLEAGQMGEYFGYALAADDFNADGYPDLVVGAPFYGDGEHYETGAVYVYANQKGRLRLQSRLEPGRERNGGRFGTTVARLGDLNRDGFNDLAVGAPYEEGGTVYIYLGTETGLSTTPSQTLRSPAVGGLTPGAPMYGHGLSKGADMDGNGYRDLAVGAPNADTVYVYRAYPVVDIRARIVPLTAEIAITDRTLDFRACWIASSAEPLRRAPTVEFEIRLDQVQGRVTTTDPTAANRIAFVAEARSAEQCREYRVNVRYEPNDVFRAIQLDIGWEVEAADRMPEQVAEDQAVQDEAAEFCGHCVAVDPRVERASQTKVVFSTGCKETRCVADLQLSSSVKEPIPYILGSTSSLVIDYTIHNGGETAFLPLLNITTPASVQFTKIPSDCSLRTKSTDPVNTLLCDLSAKTGGQPLRNGHRAEMRIHLDTTKLRAADAELVVHARASSSSDESNAGDNAESLRVELREFSTVEVIGSSTMEYVSLESAAATGLGVINVTHSLEVRNVGPSDMDVAVVVVAVPWKYIVPWTLDRVEIFDREALAMVGSYNNRFIDPVWTINNEIVTQDLLVLAAESLSVESLKTLIVDDPNVHTPNANFRRRRHQAAIMQASDEPQLSGFVLPVRHTLHDSEQLSHLPINRTILFNCDDPGAECVHAKFTVPNFRAGAQSTPIRIRLNLAVDLAVINGIVDDVHDIFVLQTMAHVQRDGDTSGETVSTVPAYPFTVVSKYAVDTVPIWVYILSALGGLLILVAITYTMHRLGFFRRDQKAEMEQLKRQSQALSLQREEPADE